MRFFPPAEILLHGRKITVQETEETYEFVLNDQLKLVQWVNAKRQERFELPSCFQADNRLNGLLFELHHVRVNPQSDNRAILGKFIEALKEIDVEVFIPAALHRFGPAYSPGLGTISHRVRFYLNNEGGLTFLSPAMKPRLVR